MTDVLSDAAADWSSPVTRWIITARLTRNRRDRGERRWEKGGDEEVTLIDCQSFPPCLNRILQNLFNMSLHEKRKSIREGMNLDWETVIWSMYHQCLSRVRNLLILVADICNPREELLNKTIEAPCG